MSRKVPGTVKISTVKFCISVSTYAYIPPWLHSLDPLPDPNCIPSIYPLKALFETLLPPFNVRATWCQVLL